MISRNLPSDLPFSIYLNRLEIRKKDGEGGTDLLDLHRLLYISHLIAQRLYSTYYPSAPLLADYDLLVQTSSQEQALHKRVLKEFTSQRVWKRRGGKTH
jgi:hypothetical protein